MKQSLLFACALILNCSLYTNSFGQISIVSSDLTSVGDQITRYGDTIPTYGPGGDGPNQIWDFSAAVIDTIGVTDVVTVASTSFGSTFTTSDYAMTGAADSYLFFEHSSSLQATTGAAGDLLGTGEIIEAPFTDPLTLHQFPRTYGSFFDDTYAFEAEADGAAFSVYRIRLNYSGHVYDTTDAYGALITPTGTYDALRVKTTDYTTSVIDVQLSQLFPVWTNFTTIMDTSVTYSWHAKEEMLAIAEFTFDSIGNPRQFTFSAVPPVIAVGIADVDEEIPFTLYPQPATEQLFIAGLNQTGNHQIAIFGIDGKAVRNETLSGNSLNVSGLKPGMYVLRITLDDGTRPVPMKFIVQH